MKDAKKVRTKSYSVIQTIFQTFDCVAIELALVKVKLKDCNFLMK